MITRRLIIVGFSALLAAVGCHRAPSDRPTNGVRLTVQDLVTNADMRVAQLFIISAAGGTLAIDTDSSHLGTTIEEPAQSALGRGIVTLVADRVAPSGQPWAYMHTLITAQTVIGEPAGGGNTSLEALPIETQLSGFFILTAKSGDYSFDTPVEIAKLRGKPVTLTFKRATN